MRFWDREREIGDLKRYLSNEPNAILFVYGPKSSGKSTLLMRVAQELKREPIRFLWYDLRKYAIEKAEDAVSVLLGAKGVSSTLAKIFDIQLVFLSIKTEELLKVFRKERDPFVLLEDELLKIREKGNMPVIVFDEIQNFKDIYLNGERRLIDRLFNFFVAITKVSHLAHVLVMTSDTFFIEEVYSSSALKNTSRYYLVDYFDDETALRILLDEGLSEDDARCVVSQIGGVPWMLEEVIESEDPKSAVEELYEDHRARLLGYIDGKKMRGEKVDETLKVLEKVLRGEFPESGEELLEMKRLVEAEVLFYDPLRREIRFQTRLDERAAKEILKD